MGMEAATAPTTTRTAIEGEILIETWGYEQTNVTFYEVIRATPKTVWLRELKQERVEGATYATYAAIPTTDETINRFRKENVLQRRYRPHWNDARMITCGIKSYSQASTWDGRPVWGSSYA